MKDLKILAVIVFFTLITYIGVEPYAHSKMHKEVEFEGFKYSDINITNVKGDAEKGKQKIAVCAGCHGIESQGKKAPMDPVAAAETYGVNPPDLSNAGAVFDKKFLTAFLVDPVHTAHAKPNFAMPPSASSVQDAADIVAYLRSIAPKEVKPKEAFITACGRCHSVKYDNWTQIGEVPKGNENIKTGNNKELAEFKVKLAKYQDKLADYLGKLPPDLSMIARARSEHFLKTFVEDPQKVIPGTAMPRVGVHKEGYEKVYTYLESVGDPSKPLREKTGPWVLGFFVIFTLLAYGWYKSQWKGLKH
jgi:ubiquinol-cytochrome c reductase cytochrome c1 subunit